MAVHHKPFHTCLFLFLLFFFSASSYWKNGHTAWIVINLLSTKLAILFYFIFNGWQRLPMTLHLCESKMIEITKRNCLLHDNLFILSLFNCIFNMWLLFSQALSSISIVYFFFKWKWSIEIEGEKERNAIYCIRNHNWFLSWLAFAIILY